MRKAHPKVDEEFALLTVLIGLELSGCEPCVLAHDEISLRIIVSSPKPMSAVRVL